MSNPAHLPQQGGEAYARFRPEYPPELAQFLASTAPQRELAVDVGCGTGQLSRQLAAHFEQVLGFDPSAEQITNARAHAKLSYAQAPAEALPVADHTASLITAAQAAHWFDLPRFYAEARRIAAPQASLALVSYGVMVLDATLDARFQHFYWHEIGPYWPPERRLVDTGYAGLDFPFEAQVAPPLLIRQHWTLNELLGYLSTWSAVRKAREADRSALLTAFAAELGELWGPPENRRHIAWPIHMRLGTL